MKNIIKKSLIIMFLITGMITLLHGQSAVFLHHSTGNGVYNEGKVKEWVNKYNTDNKTNYSVVERSYPNKPYPWENYPYDYWNLWVNGKCDPENENIQCIEDILKDFDVVIFKHCFPGAGINADEGLPSIDSKEKTISNYKLQYRALRSLMDKFSDKKFIVWTLAPLHRLSTTAEEAARAKEFVNWVKSDWLLEDGKTHPNIFVFDFFGLTAEVDQNPVNGKVNCLKYDYELNHSDGDSHPNTLANQTIGPHFAEFVVNVFNSK